jgi:hypothetical protein
MSKRPLKLSSADCRKGKPPAPCLMPRQEKRDRIRRHMLGNWYRPPALRKKGGTPGHKILTTGLRGHKPSLVKVEHMIQRIRDITGKLCTALWDTGAQILLITHQCKKEAGLKGCPALIQIEGCGSGDKKK